MKVMNLELRWSVAGLMIPNWSISASKGHRFVGWYPDLRQSLRNRSQTQCADWIRSVQMRDHASFVSSCGPLAPGTELLFYGISGLRRQRVHMKRCGLKQAADEAVFNWLISTWTRGLPPQALLAKKITLAMAFWMRGLISLPN